jgi:hypothetical protein
MMGTECVLGQADSTECGHEGGGHSEYQIEPTECGRAEQIGTECGRYDGDHIVCQAEPTECGRAKPIEKNSKEKTEETCDYEGGTANQDDCGKTEPEGKLPEYGTNGDKGGCRADPIKMGKAERERNDECGKAEHERMKTECGK